ncbi:hypothetical protein Tco_0809773, partial [Tanacetum coccineum]
HAFFTCRDVKAMEELTWDYDIDFDDDSHPVKAFHCKCRSGYQRHYYISRLILAQCGLVICPACYFQPTSDDIGFITVLISFIYRINLEFSRTHTTVRNSQLSIFAYSRYAQQIKTRNLDEEFSRIYGGYV